jgi:hypothetical protein
VWGADTQALAALEDSSGLVLDQVTYNYEWLLDQLQQMLKGQRKVQVRMLAVVEQQVNNCKPVAVSLLCNSQHPPVTGANCMSSWCVNNATATHHVPTRCVIPPGWLGPQMHGELYSMCSRVGLEPLLKCRARLTGCLSVCHTVQMEVEGEAEAARRWLGELEQHGAAARLWAEWRNLNQHSCTPVSGACGAHQGLRCSQEDLEGVRM